jgi:EAL and modified HD-GYP domain-containing signal transduction protein
MQDQAFIARQPIVDTKQDIVAYELLFRHDAAATTAEVTDDLMAGTRVLVNTLSNMGTQWLLGDKQAFINIAVPMLESEYLELLPPKQVVLEILETVEATPELIARCKQLRGLGFKLALDDFEHSSTNSPLLDVADYVKIDIQALDTAKVKEMAKLVKSRSKSIKLVAEKVEKQSEFNACKEMGFDYFQGFYFAHPETLTAKVINPAHAAVLDLLNRVRNNAELNEIELAFKRDVALSFKLLRYINSVGFGLSCEIQSIRHAVSILGYQQLYRWLTLLLVTAGNSSSSPALMKTAVTRGRLTELLGTGLLGKADQDNLFIVGVFSLLDAMLEMPMDSVMEKLTLPENITDALLNRSGIYGPFLELTEACESADASKIDDLAMALSLEPGKVNEAHLSALAWVETLGI